MKTNLLIDHPNVLSYLFHPRSGPRSSPGGPIQDIRFSVDQGVQLSGRLHFAGADSPTLLFWHGNGEIPADYDTFNVYLKMGINFLVVGYRGYGMSQGTPTGSTMLKDAVMVFEQMPEVLAWHGISSQKYFVMGRSLGCTTAIETAFRIQKGIDGLILESGRAFSVPLFERAGLGFLEDLDERMGFQNDKKIAEISIPTLVIHGENDVVIPFSDGEALFERSAGDPKRMVRISGAGHNDLMIIGENLYFKSIRNFVLGD
ncbi:alpha/beta hydrolase [Magnetococcales bacterium HHB-1]